MPTLNQKPSKSYERGRASIQVLNGKPGYINFLDAFNGWQLVRELKKATGLPATTSFKHHLTMVLQWDFHCLMCWQRFTGWICCCMRARGRRQGCSDFIALSDVCDVSCNQDDQEDFRTVLLHRDIEPGGHWSLSRRKKGQCHYPD